MHPLTVGHPRSLCVWLGGHTQQFYSIQLFVWAGIGQKPTASKHCDVMLFSWEAPGTLLSRNNIHFTSSHLRLMQPMFPPRGAGTWGTAWLCHTMRSKRAGLSSSKPVHKQVLCHAGVPTTLLIMHTINVPPCMLSWTLGCTSVSPAAGARGGGCLTFVGVHAPAATTTSKGTP